jgi:hypothetical protein
VFWQATGTINARHRGFFAEAGEEWRVPLEDNVRILNLSKNPVTGAWV